MNAKKSKNQHLFQPGDSSLFDLFDTQWVRLTCERVADLCDPVPAGWRKGIAKTCRELLLEPITEFVGRLEESARGASAYEYQDSRSFCGYVERLADNIEFSDGRELSRAESKKWAKELEERWFAFIAVASTYGDDMRRDVSRRVINQKNAKKPRPSKRVRNDAASPEITRESLAAVRDAFAKRYGIEYGWQNHAAIHFGVSASTINRKTKEFIP